MLFKKKTFEQKVREKIGDEAFWADTVLMSVEKAEGDEKVIKNFLETLKTYRASNDVENMRMLMYEMGNEYIMSRILIEDKMVIKRADLLIEMLEKIFQ